MTHLCATAAETTYNEFSLADPALVQRRVMQAYAAISQHLPATSTLVLLGVSGGATVAAALAGVRIAVWCFAPTGGLMILFAQVFRPRLSRLIVDSGVRVK